MTQCFTKEENKLHLLKLFTRSYINTTTTATTSFILFTYLLVSDGSIETSENVQVPEWL